MNEKSSRKLREELETEMVTVEFSIADVLRLHAASVFMDGRDSMARLLRKRISPVALKILKERKDL